MKTRTLITMAVASTFGLSAAAFAGTSHEVMTPSSPNESYPSAVLNQLHDTHHSMTTAMAPSEPLEQATGHDLALSDTSDWSASYDQMAEADSDLYVIGLAPMDGWDYYVLDGDTLAMIGDDTYYLVPLDTVAIVDDGE